MVFRSLLVMFVQFYLRYTFNFATFLASKLMENIRFIFFLDLSFMLVNMLSLQAVLLFTERQKYQDNVSVEST